MSKLTMRVVEVNYILGTINERWKRRQIKGEIFFVHPVGIAVSKRTCKLYRWTVDLEKFKFCTEIFQNIYGSDKCEHALNIDELKLLFSIDYLNKTGWYELLNKIETLIEFQEFLNTKFTIPSTLSRPYMKTLQQIRMQLLICIFDNELPTNEMRLIIMETFNSGISRYKSNIDGSTQFEEFIDYQNSKVIN